MSELAHQDLALQQAEFAQPEDRLSGHVQTVVGLVHKHVGVLVLEYHLTECEALTHADFEE